MQESGHRSVAHGAGRVIAIVVVIAWTTLWTGLIVGFDAHALPRLIAQWQTNQYVAATGQVERVQTTSTRHGRGVRHELHLQYSYTVGGAKFTGDTWSYTALPGTKAWVKRMASRHARGSAITVYFDPADPAAAVVQQGISGAELVVMLLLLPFHLVVVVSWWVLASFFRSTAWQSSHQVRIRDDGERLVVRLPQYSPLGTACCVMFGCALACAVVLLFSAGMHPPLWAAGVAWSLTLVLPAVVYVRMRAVVIGGLCDLTFERWREQVELPATYGRRERIVVAVAEILSIEAIEIRTVRSRGHVHYRHFTTISWRDTDATVHQGRLMEWTYRAQAAECAAWLCEQLGLEPTKQAPQPYPPKSPEAKDATSGIIDQPTLI